MKATEYRDMVKTLGLEWLNNDTRNERDARDATEDKIEKLTETYPTIADDITDFIESVIAGF